MFKATAITFFLTANKNPTNCECISQVKQKRLSYFISERQKKKSIQNMLTKETLDCLYFEMTGFIGCPEFLLRNEFGLCEIDGLSNCQEELRGVMQKNILLLDAPQNICCSTGSNLLTCVNIWRQNLLTQCQLALFSLKIVWDATMTSEKKKN